MNTSFTMFNNYHTAAKEFSNGDMAVYGRLMYIVNTYAIEGVIEEDLSPVEKLFLTSIKASIDKSIRLSEAGRKGGSKSNANSGLEDNIEEVPEENMESDTELQDPDFLEASKQACKPFKKACNEIEIESEEEIESDLEKEIESEQNKKGKSPDSGLVCSDLVFSSSQKKVFDWITTRALSLNAKNRHYLLEIADFLKIKSYDTDFLDYVFENALSQYPEKKRNLGLIYNAFTWDTTESGYKAIKKNNSKNMKNIGKPITCTVCGSKLISRYYDTLDCPVCRANGNPIYWEYDSSLKKWGVVT